MLPTTIDAIRAILKSDPTISPSERLQVLQAVREPVKQQVAETAPAVKRLQILKRRDVARMMGCTQRAVDYLSSQGHLRKCIMPGRKRAIGFRWDDVERLIG